MASTLMTPGVYIEEKNAFPNSAVAVETAVPVFIGYTETAEFKGLGLVGKAVRITSFAEYIERFGKGFVSKFDVKKVPAAAPADLSADDKKDAAKATAHDEAVAFFNTASKDRDNNISVSNTDWNVKIEKDNTTYMFNSIRLFYANGGGPCYILAVDTFKGKQSITIDTAKFTDENIFTTLEKEFEPTLIVMPDLIANGTDAYAAYTQVLAHCEKVQSRFGIFDVAKHTTVASDSTTPPSFETAPVVKEFREAIGINALKYGAAYYPWLKTSIVPANEVSLDNLNIEGDIMDFFPEKDAKAAIAQYNKDYKRNEFLRPFLGTADQTEYDGKYSAWKTASTAYDTAKTAAEASAATDAQKLDVTTKKTDLDTKRKALDEYVNSKYATAVNDDALKAATATAKANLDAATGPYKTAKTALDTAKTPIPPAVQTSFDNATATYNLLTGPAPEQVKESFYKALKAVSPTYVSLLERVRRSLNELPPSGAMAGIYTMVDNTRGVWKAPANVSVSLVNEPSVNVSHDAQQDLNVDVLAGKSINVIRSFPGIGTLVWGGRTLDGNSNDWRYINVRRTLIMIEQSIKLATRAYVFEPNDANTWITVKSMITNFLVNLWKQGALAGAAPEQAFDVQIGLGSTMTPTDILEGKMLVSVKVAIVRPAEFIVITFEQQLQQS